MFPIWKLVKKLALRSLSYRVTRPTQLQACHPPSAGPTPNFRRPPQGQDMRVARADLSGDFLDAGKQSEAGTTPSCRFYRENLVFAHLFALSSRELCARCFFSCIKFTGMGAYILPTFWAKKVDLTPPISKVTPPALHPTHFPTFGVLFFFIFFRHSPLFPLR